jgi:excinuclease ABC subunit A
MPKDHIRIQGARQNNLKGLDLELPLGELIVVTGVSGSGKSSLAFDTVYAEGQRRYVETFSPYARQFLDRMDKPQAERIEGIPPAIAIDQTNPVRTSRSTVGTMTELNDHLKLLFARATQLYCRGCGAPVRRDTPDSIVEALLERAGSDGPRALVTFGVEIPHNFSEAEIRALLERQGYTRVHARRGNRLEVVQDRLRLVTESRDRITEALEAALRLGRGHVAVYPLDAKGKARQPWRFSAELHCADCGIDYRDPLPNLFSFNSPVGACETCRGFGRTMGIDFDLVIPNPGKTLADGAVRPWQTDSYLESQGDLMRFAAKRGVPTNVPWRRLSAEHKRWVLEGEGDWEDGLWYGVRRFFDWLETKSYRMHIRVLLSKYRSYDSCPDCGGARLKDEALLWRLGTREDADRVLDPGRRFKPRSMSLSERRFRSLPGLTLHDVALLPLEKSHGFFEHLHLPAPLDEATEVLIGEIRSRLRYLVEVGLGYLTLDRQSRTLSGGEVQRINLTTALGTSLVNTLFVLDEPSIGLHPRDMHRVVEVMHRLRDAGNSLLVVEHDPQVMLAADRVLDIGPGPGERGGHLVFFGRPRALLRHNGSLTGKYLRGEKQVSTECEPKLPGPRTQWLRLRGAAEHNLKGIDVDIPLRRLVCLTGVSGSGKSTLMQDVLYNALRKLKGRPKDPPGRYRSLQGHEQIDEVVLVDQSPIGKTARSNPASYVGAFEVIRKAFAAQPLAGERGYTPGTFSFNAGNGRCPTCMGSGFERVEMQFLSDVYIRCPDCDGRRYRAEVLEVKLLPSDEGPARSIAEVLDMTVARALAFFDHQADVAGALRPLLAVGLGYLRLGQPVPTLSGGEAQRLKLAGHLAKARSGRTLFLFDEPTTGLHFDDIATLLAALRELIAVGHSVAVIEHNLDVIAAADWVIDLGPEGGEAGGHVLCKGTPQIVGDTETSHTGRALREYFSKNNPPSIPPSMKGRKNGGRGAATGVGPVDTGALTAKRTKAIEIRHAREHNLRDVNITIPRERFTVITGISGSGKSTVAFDILFNEGQRRYLESLNAYARQFVQPASRPDVDAIFGIPPTVAIEQRTSRGGRKSTVATLTEIHHFLRLLFVKLGTQYCPDCQLPIEPQTQASILARLLREYRGKEVVLLAPLVVARKGYYTDLAKWAAAKGFEQLRVDGDLLATDAWPRLDRFKEHDIDLPVGHIRLRPDREAELSDVLARALDLGKGAARVAVVDGTSQEVVFSTERACPGCGRSFEELDPRLFSYNSKHGWCEACYGTGVRLAGFDETQTGEEAWWNELGGAGEQACAACAGRRLRPEALAVRFAGRSIADFSAMPVEMAQVYFERLALKGRAGQIARDILTELRSRLAFLDEVGLGYLSLDRAAPTLSGGEAQRIRLAAQLGSNLRGVCYILDEPTIGLHPRDNRMLLDTLGKLEGKGNTVVVVEHDEETIRRAEHVIDLGPGAGVNGGRVVAQGTVRRLMRAPESTTGRYLAAPLRHPLLPRRATSLRVRKGEAAVSTLDIEGASLHNLKGLRVRIPLERLVCVTGVSGSGKSTLVREVLRGNLSRRVRRRGRRPATWHGCDGMHGWEVINRVLEVDQTPIGKTPRSCPATYIGFWDNVRRLYSQTPEARMRGYGPGRFSFNVKGGRCEACEGQGYKRIEMSFLPDVQVPCEVCGGARFNLETLAVRYKGRHIGELLGMSVDEAADFFHAHPRIHHALTLLQDVGLGYLTLGQQSPTLSGGEAQRIKLVTELAKVRPDPEQGARASGSRRKLIHSLYVLDEPTVGLHMADVEQLIRVLHRLVAAGNSVVVIEHNLDVVAEADWILDLGPEGGEGGGRLVAQGTPEQVAGRVGRSHTARLLSEFLAERGQAPGLKPAPSDRAGSPRRRPAAAQPPSA